MNVKMSDTISVKKEAQGKVTFNNGQFAEMDLCGTVGVEEGLYLEVIQASCDETQDNSEVFKERFPVGKCFRVLRTTELTPLTEPII